MTTAEVRFNKSLRPRKPEGSLGRTAAQPGRPPRLSPHSSWTTAEAPGGADRRWLIRGMGKAAGGGGGGGGGKVVRSTDFICSRLTCKPDTTEITELGQVSHIIVLTRRAGSWMTDENAASLSAASMSVSDYAAPGGRLTQSFRVWLRRVWV